MQTIDFWKQQDRCNGVVVFFAVRPNMAKRSFEFTQSLLFEAASRMAVRVKFWRLLAPSSAGTTRPEDLELNRKFRSLVANEYREYDTLIIAGSEATKYTDALLWCAGAHRVRVLNYAVPGSELDECVCGLERDEIINFYGSFSQESGQ